VSRALRRIRLASPISASAVCIGWSVSRLHSSSGGWGDEEGRPVSGKNAAAACASARSSPTPTPSPASCTAPALPLRLLLPASSCCSPDRAPLRRRVHPPAPRCRPRCPSRAPGRTFRHARASPRALDRAKIFRPRAPPQPTGPLRTHPRPQIPASKPLTAAKTWGSRRRASPVRCVGDPANLTAAGPDLVAFDHCLGALRIRLSNRSTVVAPGPPHVYRERHPRQGTRPRRCNCCDPATSLAMRRIFR
jgi:hypothetical protein